NDVSDRQHIRSATPIEMTLRDESGRELARVAGKPPDGTIFIVEPSEYACHGVETQALFSSAAQEAWQRCFAEQSRWVARWAPDVRSADGRWGRCSVPRMPIELRTSSDDWWLWWVPLRHIGGKPYTFFSITIELDRSRCQEKG